MIQTLNEVPVGRAVVIQEIPNVEIATHAMRMGISAGETVTCIARIPAGPTVIQHGGMELAIGRELSQQIQVEPR
jgi:Fe2+ transport system protein FeoA